MKSIMKIKQLFTYQDVAKALKCSDRHVEKLVRADKNFPIVRMGRSVRFDLEDVINYLKNREADTQ